MANPHHRPTTWKGYDIVWLARREECEYIGALWPTGYSTDTDTRWLTNWDWTDVHLGPDGRRYADAHKWYYMCWEEDTPDAVVLRRYDRATVMLRIDMAKELKTSPFRDVKAYPAICIPPHEFDAFIARLAMGLDLSLT